MKKPVILISSGIQSINSYKKEYSLSAFYAMCIQIAGGIPSCFCGGNPAEIAEFFDGLLLSGGGDISPSYYSQELKYNTLNINVQRDLEEMLLFAEFYKRKKPIFGICRGMQLINICFGGTLFQDIEKDLVLFHMEKHHFVTAVANTKLENLLGQNFLVNSFHHQSVKDIGKGLLAVAVCEQDGIIEAIWHESDDVFGVQWHPERMTSGVLMDTDTDMKNLFYYFTKRCGEIRQNETLHNN